MTLRGPNYGKFSPEYQEFAVKVGRLNLEMDLAKFQMADRLVSFPPRIFDAKREHEQEWHDHP